MPELPEVEIIRRGLERKVLKRKIKNVEVIDYRKRFQGSEKLLIGKAINSVDRKAKILIFNLTDGLSLLIHLKMTGQLIFEPIKGDIKSRVSGGHPSDDMVKELPNKYTHVIFEFSDGSVLYFNDLRKFGYIKIYKTDEIIKLKVIKDLGLDPFDKNVSVEYLKKFIKKRPKAKIKQILMDQSVLAGVGNIYADESLYCASVSPIRLAKDVSDEELAEIIKCVREVMDKSFKYGGSSENNYVNSEGVKGSMQDHFNIYRKVKDNCKCGGTVKRTVVGGRGTYYCPVCQK